MIEAPSGYSPQRLKVVKLIHLRSVFSFVSRTMILLVAAIIPSSAFASTQYTFYVSPTGSGSNCSLSAPCSLSGAQAQVRTVNANLSGDVIVYLRGGAYWISTTWALTSADSGSGGHRVIYAAYNGETPVINGGRVVTGWQIYDNVKQIYRAYVGTSLNTRQLFINGLRAQRARGSISPGGFTYVPASGFTTTNTAMATWGNRGDIEIVYFRDWKSFRCGVDTISGGTIVMDQPCWTNAQRHDGWKLDGVTWVENAYELLDEAGEWYFDRSSGYIYYKPRTGENLATAEVVAPVTESLVSGVGTVDNPIHDITFKGITFSYNTWTRPNSSEGYPTLQAGFQYADPSSPVEVLYKVPAAVSFTVPHSIVLERNIFTHLGSAGLNFEYGSQDNLVIGNRFEDVSASGIQLGHPSESHPSDSRLVLKNNTIKDNYITAIGAEYHDSIGVFGAYTENTLIEHNELRRLPYSGISLGWGWGSTDVGGSAGFTTPTPAKLNKIQFNLIVDTMRTLRDGGAIYTLGAQPTSTINNNYVNQMTNDYGGIYLDEGTQYFDVNNNVLGAVPRWLYIWTTTIRNNSVRFNFADTANKTVNSVSNIVSDNQEGLGSWPAAASAIISAAGIEAAYQDIRGQAPFSPTTPNIALNKNTVSSSDYSASYSAARATDGSTAGGWSPTGADPQPWIQIDLGSPTVINGLELVSRQDDDQDATRRNFEVRGSNDPNFATSTVLASQGGTPFAARDTWTSAVNDATGYRYIRFIKSVGAEYFFVAEVRVYGDPASTPPPAGQVNFALGQPTTSSSDWNSDFTAAKGTDGDVNSGWSPGGSDIRPWLQVDLGAPRILQELQFVSRQDLDNYTTRRNFEVRGSDDPSFATFTVLGSQGDTPFAHQATWSGTVTDSTGYRYVRIVKTVDNDYLFVGELRALGGGSASPPSGSLVNIAQDKATTTSSDYAADYAGYKSTDGDIGSGWSPSGSDIRPWLQVDLGSAKVIQGLEFVSRQDLDQSNTRRNFEIQASNDPAFSSFVTLGSQGSTSFSFQGTWSANVSDTTPYRYVRMIKTVDNDYLFVSELRVLASN